MIDVLREKLDTPRTWRGPDIQDDPSWTMTLTRNDVAEIDAALRHVQALGLDIPFTADDFPLPTLAAKLNDVPERMENGLGVVLIRGLPRDIYTAEECGLIYWGFGVISADRCRRTRAAICSVTCATKAAPWKTRTRAPIRRAPRWTSTRTNCRSTCLACSACAPPRTAVPAR